MRSRYCVKACTLLTVMSAVTAVVSVHAAANSKDWHGSLTQSTLPDSSILSEYVASTSSAGLGDAVLRVSFVPRFGCSPIIAVLVPRDLSDERSNQDDLVVKIDREMQEFPVLTDLDEPLTRYSFNADSAGHQALREKFDQGYSVNVAWMHTMSESNSVQRSATFSLLGSRTVVKAQEQQCLNHEPIPYSN